MDMDTKQKIRQEVTARLLALTSVDCTALSLEGDQYSFTVHEAQCSFKVEVIEYILPYQFSSRWAPRASGRLQVVITGKNASERKYLLPDDSAKTGVADKKNITALNKIVKKIISYIEIERKATVHQLAVQAKKDEQAVKLQNVVEAFGIKDSTKTLSYINIKLTDHLSLRSDMVGDEYIFTVRLTQTEAIKFANALKALGGSEI